MGFFEHKYMALRAQVFFQCEAKKYLKTLSG